MPAHTSHATEANTDVTFIIYDRPLATSGISFQFSENTAGERVAVLAAPEEAYTFKRKGGWTMADDRAGGLSTIGQIGVPVKDITRAVAFYRDVLGLPFLFQAGNLAFFDCDGTRLLLDGVEEAAGHASSILYFRVDDIEFATETLRMRGVEIVSEPHMIAKMPDHDLWMSFFLDSEGHTMALMAEVQPV